MIPLTMDAQPRITDGARALRKYLDDTHQNISTFCTTHSLSRFQVARALNGDRERFSVDFGDAVEIATKGAVPCRSWRSATLQPLDQQAA